MHRLNEDTSYPSLHKSRCRMRPRADMQPHSDYMRIDTILAESCDQVLALLESGRDELVTSTDRWIKGLQRQIYKEAKKTITIRD